MRLHGWTAGVALATLGMAMAAGGATAQGPTLKVGGLVYAQYSYQISDTIGRGNNFDITRAYVNLRGSFDHGIGTRVTTDIYRAANGSLDLRLKYAYVTWTPESSPVTLKFGQIHTPWLDWVEALWGYRLQSPMAIERAGYITSSDLGFGVDGSWGGEKFNMQAVVVNGEGYHGTPGDRRKDFEARASYRLMGTDDASRVGGLRLTGYGQLGAYTGGGARDRFAGMLSYRSSALTMAGEYAVTRDAPGDADIVNGTVMSALGVLRLPRSPFQVIGRVDVVDPNTDARDDGHTVLVGGVSYQLSPNVLLLADVDHGLYQSDILDPEIEAFRSRALFQVEFTF